MQLSGEYIFHAPRVKVWAALQNPDVLGAIMPGGEGFEQVGEDRYTGILNIKVGPVQGRFEGTVQLSEKQPPESYHMTVDGKGGPGFVKAEGGMKLDEEGDGTRLTYSLDAQIGGRIATVGQRLVDASARSIVKQSLDSLQAYLESASEEPPREQVQEDASAGEAAASESARTSTYKPPSQSRVALNVAKDVAGDLIPARRRPLFVAVGVLVAAAILYFFFR